MSPQSIPIQGFDEERYLQANPDVREAIASGIIASGLIHYRRFGRDEGRLGGPEESKRPSYKPLTAMPPDALRKRVHGDTDLASFDRHGRSICGDLLDTIAGFRIHLDADAKVLDFGCGCGRVFRHLAPQCDAQVEGSDIDAEAIAWSNSNLKDGAFRQNPEMPPLPFEDGRFDLIYSISVFTHLPEDMQLAWLAELVRVAKPGAFLLLTVHGPDLLPVNDADAAKLMVDYGFCYLRLEATEGLPDFYRTAYHAEHYIRREWTKLIQIEGVLRREIGGHQDLVVARLPE